MQDEIEISRLPYIGIRKHCLEKAECEESSCAGLKNRGSSMHTANASFRDRRYQFRDEYESILIDEREVIERWTQQLDKHLNVAETAGNMRVNTMDEMSTSV